MKLAKRIATASLALVLALSLTACSPKDMLGNMILGAADLLGLRSEDTGDDEAEETLATPGGSITFPEGMDTQSRFPTRYTATRCTSRSTASPTAAPITLWRRATA